MSEEYPDWIPAGSAEAFDAALPREEHRPAAGSGEAGRVRLDLAALAEWLPRLGTVLWLERRDSAPAAPLHVSSGLRLMRLDHAAAGLLARCTSLAAWSQVTPQGPREWLCFHADSGETIARLYLLPDSDVLAWDQMCAAHGLVAREAASAEASMHATLLRRALARFASRWQARLLAFDLRPLTWLHTLDAKAPLRISLLGLDLARTIVRDENAEALSPLHIG